MEQKSSKIEGDTKETSRQEWEKVRNRERCEQKKQIEV
jgi:hypothetical protein